MDSLAVLLCLGLFCGSAVAGELEVRGLHWTAPAVQDIPLLSRFIEETLPREGVNVLVLELNYRYRYQSHPELVADGAVGPRDIKALLSACRKSGVRLIPQFNCLGHQSWADKTFPLLTHYPEFDETPGSYPNNEGIYCRSYCPLHPEVHTVVLSLIDELLEVFEAEDFHVGMDEVFLLGEDQCPRCKGADKADLFAGEVKKLHQHLAEKGVRMWMWGDRLIDGATTGIGKWEASLNETAPAIDMIPKDIVICDWHYEFSPPTAAFFTVKGFPVVSCPWREKDVALDHLSQIQAIRQSANSTLADRALGIMHTTWGSPGDWVRAYFGESGDISSRTRESAECFKQLMAAVKASVGRDDRGESF